MSRTGLLLAATLLSLFLVESGLSQEQTGLGVKSPAGLSSATETKSSERLQVLLGFREEQNYTQESQRMQMQMDEMVKNLITNHPAVLEASAQKSLQQSLSDANGDNYLPSLSAGGSLSRSKTRPEEGHISRDAAEGGVKLNYNLYKGGADATESDKGNAQLAKAEIGLEKVLAEARIRLKRAFSNHNQAQMEKILISESVQNTAMLRMLSEQKYKAGLVGQIDVMQAQMQEQEAKARLVRAETRVAITFQEVLGSVPREAHEDESLLAFLRSLSEMALPVSADLAFVEERRGDFQEAQALLDVSIAAFDLEQAKRGRYLPSVDLFSDWGKSWASVEASGGPDADQSREETLRFGVELSVPLYVPRNHSAVRTASIQQLTAQARKDQTTFIADQRWRSLKVQVKELMESLPIYRKTYEQAYALYEARLLLYKAGSDDMFSVTNAEAGRLTALSNWFEIRSNIQNAALDLEAANAGLILGLQSSSSF
jgi:outer membrane protein TolC